jgi:hypothetical protein
VRIDDEDVDRLPADDAVGVIPVEGDVEAVGVADGPAEAGEFLGFDTGGDDHGGAPQG